MYFSKMLPEDIFYAYSVSCMLERCVGFMMAKMVLRELMDPVIFTKFKSFLKKVFTFLFFLLISTFCMCSYCSTQGNLLKDVGLNIKVG